MAERSVMALIQVTGYITDNLAPQTGQSGRPYVRFELLEITGSGKKRWTQYYQVWKMCIRDSSMMMLICIMIIYLVVLCTEVLGSLGAFFG